MKTEISSYFSSNNEDEIYLIVRFYIKENNFTLVKKRKRTLINESVELVKIYNPITNKMGKWIFKDVEEEIQDIPVPRLRRFWKSLKEQGFKKA